MSVRLTVKQRSEQGGADKASTVMLDDDIITLGRDQACQVVLAQHAVSRSHARISRDGSLFFVEDLGSSYGTQINGHKLPKGEKHLLRNGDVIARTTSPTSEAMTITGGDRGDQHGAWFIVVRRDKPEARNQAGLQTESR